MMNILLLGSGGREHAFAWKLTQSSLCETLFIAPGNAGTSHHGKNVPLNPNDFEEVSAFCLSNKVDMVVVGPEDPLVRGIIDYFKNDGNLRHIKVVGPSMEGAKLEGSKAYGKIFMAAQNIPTAAYKEFTPASLNEGLEFISQQTPPVVLKADGLAAGKGVVIAQSLEEAKEELKAMLSGKFGAASEKVVIEQFLSGIEFSVFVLTDGTDYKILPIAKDYKKIGEGDTGLNTGGMGAISPPPFVDDVMMQKVVERVVEPTLVEIQNRKIDYKGFVFIGLISVENEPYVIEYNCRMGDPETEVVLPRLKTDLVELLNSLFDGSLNSINLELESQTAATVMLVSGGYPQKYEKGKILSGIESVENSLVFHAGTKNDNGQILTNGGRVMALTSFGNNFQDAVNQSLENAKKVKFEGKYYRKDIGFDL